MYNFKDAQKLAKEWARDIQEINAPYHVIAEEVAWGFQEVENGGNPTLVMKELKARIQNRKQEIADAQTIRLT